MAVAALLQLGGGRAGGRGPRLVGAAVAAGLAACASAYSGLHALSTVARCWGVTPASHSFSTPPPTLDPKTSLPTS